VFDVAWRIICPDAATHDVLALNFSELRAPLGSDEARETLVIRHDTENGRLLRRESRRIPIRDDYELVYHVEKTITIDTQRRRPDLFFLHAAALELDGSALLLIAPSGAGKSTTAWALVNRGFGYLSDELAAVALDAMTIAPYPHAPCLKRPPPAPFDLPAETLVTGQTLHVPAHRIPSVCRRPVPLAAVVFNRFDPAAEAPLLQALGAGEASVLVYRNGLNQLVHERAGLAAAVRVARAVPCYRLVAAGLEATCALLEATMRAHVREMRRA